MAEIPRLFLYSLQLTKAHHQSFSELVGKTASTIRIGLIENAADVIPDSAGWVRGIRDSLKKEGYGIEAIDLREWTGKTEALRGLLFSKDVIWIGGGHTYYLAWILRSYGADRIIRDFVQAGHVYAGWSAGAVVAGPTTLFYDAMGDDPAAAPEYVSDGLGLTEISVVPHINNSEFRAEALETETLLKKAGYKPVALEDEQVLLIRGNYQSLV